MCPYCKCYPEGKCDECGVKGDGSITHPYTSEVDLDAKPLHEVAYVILGPFLYQVKGSTISNIWCDRIDIVNGKIQAEYTPAAIFTYLGIREIRRDIAAEAYGYEVNPDNYWPCARSGDFAACERLVRKLMRLVIVKEKSK